MRALKWILTSFVVVFILAPLIVVAVVSFNENRYMDFPPEGFSLHWYAELWNDTGWRDAIVTSLLVAATSAALALVIATPMAFVLRAYDIRLAPAIFALGILPFMLPIKWLVYRSGIITAAIWPLKIVAERAGITIICGEMYSHLLWRSFYQGVFAARRRRAGRAASAVAAKP
jgi:ABC-type spermidine/putrescine transport system permease subunit II